MRVWELRPAEWLRLSVVALVACNAIAGIGQPILETEGGTSETPDGSTVADANGVQPRDDSGTPDTSVEDASVADTNVPDTNVADTNVPDTFTPPPAAARPGFDTTAGGTYGKSASYSLIAVVSEGPGGNNVGSSQHYVLKAGVIATTQPN